MKTFIQAPFCRAITLISIALLGFTPLAASAAIVAVDFGGYIYESYSDEGDDITGTYSDIFGTFFVDTTTPTSGFPGEYTGAVFGMEVYRDGTLLLTQEDFVCAQFDPCANDVFVTDQFDAEVYVQDFYVGNLEVVLNPAGDTTFNNDINIFLLAAQGEVTDIFEIFNSYGSVQVDGEDYFELDYLAMQEVSQVPVPAAAWLFGSALAGLGWMRRRKTP